MRWFETRGALLVVGAAVLVVCLELGGVMAVKAYPMPLNYGTWLSEGRESFRREKRGEVAEVNSNNVGREGVKSLDAASSSSVDGGSKDDSHKTNVSNSASESTGETAKVVKQKTLVIPDRTPANYTGSNQAKEETQGGEEESDDGATKRPQGEFDDKAIQRTIIVIAGIAVIVVAYLAIKFMLIKRRKVAKRYGRVEASEMDLLDEIEDDDESEEEELFDINQQRRS